MRNLEYLVQSFPEKTCEEILEMQTQDKLDDEKEFQKINQNKLKWIKDINVNGGFFKGRFGVDQRFFYNVTNCILDENGNILCNVEKIVVFLGAERGVLDIGCVRIEKKIYKDVNEDNYMFDYYEKVTESEWNEIDSYTQNIKQFWE